MGRSLVNGIPDPSCIVETEVGVVTEVVEAEVDATMADWATLDSDPELAKRGFQYRKTCLKRGVPAIPPSQWLRCEACDYIAPGSLVNHITTVHGGLIAYAKSIGKLPETIKTTNDAVVELCRVSGALGAAATNAKRVVKSDNS